MIGVERRGGNEMCEEKCEGQERRKRQRFRGEERQAALTHLI